MKYIKSLPEPDELTADYPISEENRNNRIERLNEIRDILEGSDRRKLIIVGPCSADNEDSVLEYACRLRDLQEKVSDRLLLIPRIYTSKPRTNGKGYKGLVHRPESDSPDDDLISGIASMRRLHVRVVEETGLFAADELLYPELYRYLEDLLVYVAIGARSVEDQQHRLIASGMDVPVGMKNPLSGSLTAMLNSIVAAQSRQHLPFGGWEVETEGNEYAHAMLRGYTNAEGKNVPNYYYEDICILHDMYVKLNLRNPSVIIDCNHGNSDKKFEEQIRIAENVWDSCARNTSIDRFVKGIMIESYLVDGSQMIGEGQYGCSITDPCLGWEKTERLIRRLADE